MTNIEQKSNYLTYTTIAKISFVIFLFFAIFGTTLPFQPRVEEIDEISTSNFVNQILFTLLFLISILLLIPKRNEFFLLIKKEKFLSLFLTWCFVSISWSNFSFVSFKRWFTLFTTVLVFFCFLLYVKSNTEIIKYFKIILYSYLTISIISVFIIPGATDPLFNTWRGLTPHKNHLGQMSLLSIIFCFIALKSSNSFKEKLVNYSMLFFSIILLIGSTSTTSVLSFLIFISICILLIFDFIFKPLGVGNSFSIIFILSCLLIFIVLLLRAPELIELIPNAFGKDMTFTGRVKLWEYMLREVNKHLLLGTGYQGFWVNNFANTDLMILYEEFVWLPLQSHNGYIDILNEVGMVGIIIFFLMIVYYIINLIKLQSPNRWYFFIIIILLINFQESNLFRPGIFAGTIFLFSYLNLYAQLLQQDDVCK